MKKHYLLSFLLTVFFTSALFAQTTRYVSLDGDDANNGSTWATSYRNLQTAIDASSDGDLIFVEKGKYDLTASIVMKEGVKIYGSFDGTETSLAQRDISDFANDSTKATILKSNGNQRVITNNFSDATKLTEATVLDGFVITGGGGVDKGGGIYNYYASPKFSNLIISNNTATGGLYASGGGMFNEFSSAYLTDIVFSENSAINYASGAFGGGLALRNSKTTLVKVTIRNNTSNSTSTGRGGGVSIVNFSELIATNVIIKDNNATGDSTTGGGIYNVSSYTSILTNVVISGNTSATHGGGIYNLNNAQLYLSNVVISGNSAEYGGGIVNKDSSPKIYNSIILGNTVTNSAPGVFNEGSASPDIQYSLVEDLSDTTNQNLDATGVTLTDIFTDPTNDDFSPKDLRVLVNAGNNTLYTNAGGNIATDKDMAGNSRVFEETIDIGAYESQTWVDPPIKVTQIQPLNSTSGKTITIYGVGFDAISSDNTVIFTPAGGGTGTTATVTSGTSTQLSVTVPSVTGGNYKISATSTSDNATSTSPQTFSIITGGGDFGAPGSGEHVVSTAADGIQSVHAADVDGDGDIDLMSASENTDEIAWYKNDGSQNFTKQVVSTDAFYARDVYSADLDGDGDIDIISASAVDQKIAWYKNDGAADPSFTEIVVSDSTDGANSVFAIDLDGDGDIDLMSAASVDDEISWFENDGSQNFTENVVSTNANGAFDVRAMDVDGDGDMDLLSASSEDDKIAWYENDGSQNFTEHVVSTNANFAHSVFAADLDGDGDIDLMSASQTDDKIAWYENDGSQNFTERVVSNTADGARSVYAADMDADGDLDLITASRADDKIAMYVNDGATDPTFTEVVLGNSADGAWGIFIIDVDNDGDLDVIAGSQNDDKIAWYENGSAISIAGRSLAFDGSGDYIEVADTNALDLTNSFTLEAWVKTSFGENPKPIIHKEGAYTLNIQNTNINLIINGSNDYQMNHTFAPNQWVHVAVTFDPNNDATYFVNGKMIGYVSGSTPASNSANPLLLGGTSSAGSIDGNLDEVRIWNEVRGITKIQTNMFQVLSGDENNLVAYFPFNEENGLETNDKSSNEFIGDLIGDVAQSDDTHPYGTIITGTEGWRMFSTPVVNTSYGTLLDTLWTQGFTGADNANFSPNVLVWNEAAKSFSAIDNATDIPATATGFIAYVYDDQDKNGVADGFPKVIQVDSTQFSGSTSPELTFTDSGNLANDGWNLVGNPYGSTIDWDATSGLTSTNLDASFYVWSSSANSGSGAYLSWNGSTGTLSGGEIAPWQGFWVKANAADPTLSLTDEARSSNGTFLKKNEVPVLTFTLTGNELESSTIVSLQADASIDKDKYDAYKLGSLNETFLSLFTSLDNGDALDINALPFDLDQALSIPFDMDGSNLDGDFELNWDAKVLPDDWSFTLINNSTGEEIDLLKESSFSIELDAPAKQISSTENAITANPTHSVIQPSILKAKAGIQSRFTLRIVPSGVSVSNENTKELPSVVELQQNYPNPFNPTTTIAFGIPESGKVTLEVFDVLGRKVMTLLNGESKSAGRYTVNFDANNLSSGMYIYRLQTGNSVITKKLTLIK